MTDTDEREPAERIMTVGEARFEAERRYNGYMAQDAFVAGAAWSVNAHVSAEASAIARAEAAERLNGDLVAALQRIATDIRDDVASLGVIEREVVDALARIESASALNEEVIPDVD